MSNERQAPVSLTSTAELLKAVGFSSPEAAELARSIPADSAISDIEVPLQPRTGVDRWLTPKIILGATRAVEFLIAATAGAAGWLYHGAPWSGLLPFTAIAVVLLTAIAVPAALQAADLYSIQALRSLPQQWKRLVAAWAMIFAALAVLSFVTRAGDELSVDWLTVWFLAGAGGLFAFRGAMFALVRSRSRSGLLERNAVIVGGGQRAADLIEALRKSADSDIRIIGLFDDRSSDRSPDIVAGLPKLGNIAELVALARKVRIDLLIVSLPLNAENRLLEILRRLWVLPVDIRLSAHTDRLRFRPRAYSYIGSVALFDVFDKPLADWDYVLKTIEDRVIAAIALVLLSPLMALTALAIKLDSKGPVFFRQKRFGFNNDMVEVYKFRSLRTDMSDADAATLVTRGDPRVTRVGRFIRKTSIDELPQLINVLRGELSLVGPRPHAVMAKAADRLYTDVVDGYFARHKVKPGITGWAQVNGWRGETDTQEKIQRRVEHDLYYIENWSILFDLYILAITPFSLLKTDHAY